MSHSIREQEQTVIGLAQILAETIPDRQQRHDVEALVAAQSALLETRISVIEERLRGLLALIGALGAALGVVASALAILAD